MYSSSVAVLGTLLVAILSVAQIQGSPAFVAKLSSAAGEEWMVEVEQMEKRGDVVMEPPMLRPRSPSGPTPQAVCGPDTARQSNQTNICKLTAKFIFGETFTCSGWVVSQNEIATAGSCILDRMQGVAIAVAVTCGGGFKSAGSNIALTTELYEYKFLDKEFGTMWADAAVVKLRKPLPSTVVPWKFGDGSCASASASLSVLLYSRNIG